MALHTLVAMFTPMILALSVLSGLVGAVKVSDSSIRNLLITADILNIIAIVFLVISAVLTSKDASPLINSVLIGMSVLIMLVSTVLYLVCISRLHSDSSNRTGYITSIIALAFTLLGLVGIVVSLIAETVSSVRSGQPILETGLPAHLVAPF